MSMPAFVPAPDAPARTVLGDVAEPSPAPNEALVAVEAYSVNRGEIFLLEAPRDGWRPGQDVAGRVERAAADGSGPAAGTRVASRGKLIWYGQTSREPGTLDFSVAPAATFASIVPFIYWRTGASDADDLATLVRLVDGGRLHPEIGLVADWRETPDALIALRDRRVRGNAVLTVG